MDNHDLDIKNLHFTSEDTGSLFTKTYSEYKWKFTLDGIVRNLSLYHSKILGRRTIYLGDREICRYQRYTYNFHFSFPLDVHTISITQNEDTYILKIDGVSFNKLLNEQKLNRFNIIREIFSDKNNKINKPNIKPLMTYKGGRGNMGISSRIDDSRRDNKYRTGIYNSNRVDEIENDNYDLTPGRYLLSNLMPIEGFTFKMMGDLVDCIFKTTKNTGRGKLIRPALLSKDEFTFLDADSLQEDDYKKGYGIIEGNALLYSPLSSMRPTLLLNPNGEKLYYKTDTLHAVHVKEDAVLPEYVVLELYKSYIQEQVMVLAKGDVIPRLGLNEFKCLRIAIPRNASQALEEERKLVDERKNLYFSKVNAELVALKDKQHEDYIKMLRQRKHRIGQLLGDLVPGFDTLDDFRKENGGVLKDTDVIAIKTGETVDDYFTILHNIIYRIDSLVKNLTDREEWGKPSMIDIDDFLNNLPNIHLKENFDFQFLMRQDIHLEGSRKYIVLANESELSTVFENIIKNASKYGFTDEERNDYRIRISVDDDMIDNNPAVRICVSNNGTPIHPSLDRNRFFEWGYGNGDGIGTWQLKDIIEHYNGTIRLNEYPDDVAGFCTEYEIVLPLKLDE